MNKLESRIIHSCFFSTRCANYLFRDYLKGFHKRKLERRERAQKELEDEIKSDLKNLRQKVFARWLFRQIDLTLSF